MADSIDQARNDALQKLQKEIEESSTTFREYQSSLNMIYDKQYEDVENSRQILYKIGMDYVNRSAGLGPYQHQIATTLAKIDRFGLNPGYANYVKPGLTFMTRPHLNFNSYNISGDRILKYLDTKNPIDIKFAIRCMLDTTYANTEGYLLTQECPYLDFKSPWFTWITNNLVSLSGGPQFNIEPDNTDSGGYYGESQTIALGSESYRKPFDLNLTITDPIGGPIQAAIFFWMYAMQQQYLGSILAYPADIEAQILNYTVSIYRFLLDVSGKYIRGAYKFTGCWPMSRPGASLADFQREQQQVDAAREFSIGFRCSSGVVDENDPIIFKEFNDLACRYNPKFKDKFKELILKADNESDIDEVAKRCGLQRNLLIPEHNYCGLPYITFTKKGPRIDFFSDPIELEQLGIVEQQLNSAMSTISQKNAAYNQLRSNLIKDYYQRALSSSDVNDLAQDNKSIPNYTMDNTIIYYDD